MTMDIEAIVSRLRRTRPHPERPYKSDAVIPINPDGPEIADALEALNYPAMVEAGGECADELEGLLGYLDAHHFDIQPIAEKITKFRAALGHE